MRCYLRVDGLELNNFKKNLKALGATSYWLWLWPEAEAGPHIRLCNLEAFSVVVSSRAPPGLLLLLLLLWVWESHQVHTGGLGWEWPSWTLDWVGEWWSWTPG